MIRRPARVAAAMVLLAGFSYAQETAPDRAHAAETPIAPAELDAARAAYDHAREVYRRLIQESPPGS